MVRITWSCAFDGRDPNRIFFRGWCEWLVCADVAWSCVGSKRRLFAWLLQRRTSSLIPLFGRFLIFNLVVNLESKKTGESECDSRAYVRSLDSRRRAVQGMFWFKSGGERNNLFIALDWLLPYVKTKVLISQLGDVRSYSIISQKLSCGIELLYNAIAAIDENDDKFKIQKYY